MIREKRHAGASRAPPGNPVKPERERISGTDSADNCKNSVDNRGRAQKDRMRTHPAAGRKKDSEGQKKKGGVHEKTEDQP